MYSKIQYISQGSTATEQLHNIKQALDAGCTWIQLRFKNADTLALTKIAEQVKSLCNTYTAILILNDQVKVAKDIEADGVHLGLNDMSIVSARTILGTDKIIGGTANTLQDILRHVAEQCNYIGLGPLRFTTTKEKLSPVLGLSGYQEIMNELKKQEIKTPVYAIGGVTPEDIPDLIACSVYGIAASGMITHQYDKKQLIKNLKISLYEPTEYSQSII